MTIILVISAAISSGQGTKGTAGNAGSEAPTVSKPQRTGNYRNLEVLSRAEAGIYSGQAYVQKYGAESEYFASLAKWFALAKSLKAGTDFAATGIEALPEGKLLKPLAYDIPNSVGDLLASKVKIDIDENGHFTRRWVDTPAITHLEVAADISSAVFEAMKWKQTSGAISGVSNIVRTGEQLSEKQNWGAAAAGSKVIGSILKAWKKDTLDTSFSLLGTAIGGAEGISDFRTASNLLRSQQDTTASSALRAKEALLRFDAKLRAIVQSERTATVPPCDNCDVSSSQTKTPGTTPTSDDSSHNNTSSQNTGSLRAEAVTDPVLPTKIVVLTPPAASEAALEDPLLGPHQIPGTTGSSDDGSQTLTDSGFARGKTNLEDLRRQAAEADADLSAVQRLYRQQQSETQGSQSPRNYICQSGFCTAEEWEQESGIVPTKSKNAAGPCGASEGGLAGILEALMCKLGDEIAGIGDSDASTEQSQFMVNPALKTQLQKLRQQSAQSDKDLKQAQQQLNKVKQ
jgi:hypothetical protein